MIPRLNVPFFCSAASPYSYPLPCATGGRVELESSGRPDDSVPVLPRIAIDRSAIRQDSAREPEPKVYSLLDLFEPHITWCAQTCDKSVSIVITGVLGCQLIHHHLHLLLREPVAPQHYSGALVGVCNIIERIRIQQ